MRVNIEDFISETLKQIVRGVQKAQDDVDGDINIIAPFSGTSNNVEEVKFTISAIADESEEGKMGWGVFVAGFGVGGKGSRIESEQTTQNIEFSVPVMFPTTTRRKKRD